MLNTAGFHACGVHHSDIYNSRLSSHLPKDFLEIRMAADTDQFKMSYFYKFACRSPAYAKNSCNLIYRVCPRLWKRTIILLVHIDLHFVLAILNKEGYNASSCRSLLRVCYFDTAKHLFWGGTLRDLRYHIRVFHNDLRVGNHWEPLVNRVKNGMPMDGHKGGAAHGVVEAVVERVVTV